MATKFADPAAIFVIDDTTFPKQGRHSVGVQRQYCGALGKKANCQCAVSVHYVAPKGHYPLDMRLYLPESWLGDPERLDKAKVPAGERRSLTKGQIALELLDRARAEGLPGGLVVADSGYGVPGRSRIPLPWMHYIVGVTDEMSSSPRSPTDEPKAGTGGRVAEAPPAGRGSPRPGEPSGWPPGRRGGR